MMKLLPKRILAMALAGLLLLTLLPMRALAEEEGSIAPVWEGENAGQISPVEETERKEEALCRLRFVCHPEDTRLLLQDPTRLDGNGDYAVILPEADGSWLLEQGEYLFSAWHKGYEAAERVSFFTGGKAEKTIDLSLRPLAPMNGNDGDGTLYEPAFPLPAMTGNQAVDTANVARSQLGYTYSDGTVYGAWWTEVTSWGWDYTRDDWCAMFACWCSTQAGVGLDKAYSKYGANANYLMEWQVEHCSSDKTFATSPKAGDFLFFGGSDGRAGHVGIVTDYHESTRRVTFVGGNQGGPPSRVSEGTILWDNDSYWGYQVLLGYGRPNYSGSGEAVKAGLDSAAGGAGTLSVSGWAFDPDDPASPVWVHVYVGGPAGSGASLYKFEAKAYREDVEARFPGAGLYHGFNKNFSVAERGNQTIYFYACDLGPVQQEVLFAQAQVNITDPLLQFYTVSYDANGGEGAPEEQFKSHDVPLTLSSVLPTRADESESITVTLDPRGGSVSSNSLSAVKTKHYAFKEWNTAANGRGVPYFPGAAYVTNANVTLYAQWSSTTETEELSLPTPLRSGYRFLGWAREQDAASGFTGSFTPEGDLTLYAIWEADADFLPGDANGDGDVDVLDLVRLRKSMAGQQVELKLSCVDLNGDGQADGLDLLLLRKLLVGAG